MTPFIGDYPLARSARLTFHELNQDLVFPLESTVIASNTDPSKVGLVYIVQLDFRSSSFDYLEGHVSMKSNGEEYCE